MLGLYIVTPVYRPLVIRELTFLIVKKAII